MATTSETIKKLRLNLNLTQKELAEKSSLSESSIKSYESGTRNPKVEALEKISAALNCDSFDLIYPEENRIENDKNERRESIFNAIKVIASLSNIDMKRMISDPLYDGDLPNLEGIEFRYKNMLYSLTSEEYYKLADRIIDSIAVNILAAKDY